MQVHYIHSYVTYIAYCYHSLNRENQGSGQQCCYDKQGGLLIGPDSGGTVDLYSNKLHFWKHTIFDVAPFILCCRTLRANCQAYYDKRPSDDGSRYSARRCGMYICVYVL